MSDLQARAEELAAVTVMSPEGAETVLRNIEVVTANEAVHGALMNLAGTLSMHGYDDAEIALGIAAMGRTISEMRGGPYDRP